MSNESKRVLAYAAEEAERFGQEHIGSEHLFAGTAARKGSFCRSLLNSRGPSLDRAREIVSKGQHTAEHAHDVLEIHGEEWDLGYVQAQLRTLQKFAWRKRPCKPLDILVETSSRRISFDVTTKAGSYFELVTGGWSRDFCSVCHWELNADGGPGHAEGYTNGREWLCIECYEKFMEPVD